MPTYEYKCGKCQNKTEIFHKITDSPAQKCPSCGELSLSRGPGGGIGLAFSGTGWYKTDYASNKPKEATNSQGECCPCGKNSSQCSS